MQSPTYFGSLGNSQVLASLDGQDVVFTPAAALKVGDAVFISAANTVNKSTTAGDRLKRVGFVVGGDLTAMAVVSEGDTGMVGVTACTATTGRVIVRISGVAYGVVGAAAVTAGAQLFFDATTAGRVIPATPTTDAGKIVGTAIGADATAGNVVKVLVNLA